MCSYIIIICNNDMILIIHNDPTQFKLFLNDSVESTQ